MEWYKKSNKIEYWIALILFTISLALTVFNIFWKDITQGLLGTILLLMIFSRARTTDRIERIENKLNIK